MRTHYRRTGRKRAILGSRTFGKAKVGEDEGPNEPLYPPKIKKCLRCKKDMYNYFTCSTCFSELRWKGQDIAEAGWEI